jgi:hypothetical protein
MRSHVLLECGIAKGARDSQRTHYPIAFNVGARGFDAIPLGLIRGFVILRGKLDGAVSTHPKAATVTDINHRNGNRG